MSKLGVFDPAGDYLTSVTREYARKALARGEVVKVDGHLVVVPQPVHQLTPDERRRIHLAKIRAKR